MSILNRWLKSDRVKPVAVAMSIIAIIITLWVLLTRSSEGTPGDPNNRTYICSETGKPFSHRNQIGDAIPILSPFSGKNTGYIAEPCYWTADGGTKTEPTWVLLNESVHKPGPTFCPDCGRLVVGHNPVPAPGIRPPPKQQQMANSSALPNAPSRQNDR